jgi:sugar lactone lactonase YvrE
MKISALSEHRCRLGEGPVWDAEDAALYWVDSLAPRLYRYRDGSRDIETWELEGAQVGSLAVREQGGLVLAMDRGFHFFEPQSGRLERIAEPLAGRQGLRFNDGKVDPFGSFVAGAMNLEVDGVENASMYRLTPALEVIELVDGFQCFNGPCFSADGERLYVTGRRPGVIEVFEYGREQRPRNPAVLLDNCNPDGATVDAEGFIWSAQWDDECLLRIAADGHIDTRLAIPGQVATSVMFGGAGLERIFVTTLGCDYYGTAATGEAPGRLLVVDGSGFRGRAEARFKG